MRSKLVLITIVVIAGAAGVFEFAKLGSRQPNNGAVMEITSAAFTANNPIPAVYTCKGDNINPPLTISDVPTGTQSLVVIVDDPDAPGGTFDHWIVWNISPDLVNIPRNWTPGPGAVQGANGSGEAKYMGPCPPSGVHHYHFKVFALNNTLDLKAGSNASDLATAMDGHIIGQGELIGTFGK